MSKTPRFDESRSTQPASLSREPQLWRGFGRSSAVFRAALVALLAAAFAAAGCGEDEPGEGVSSDGELDSALPNGKADSPYSDCQLDAVLLLVNDPKVDADVLKAAGVHSRAVRNLMDRRAGKDLVAGTEDDTFFADLEAVDAVPYVGAAALSQLIAAAGEGCVGQVYPDYETIFSPQPYEVSHLAKARELIEGAKHSVDIAMYSFSDAKIRSALGDAVARGVKVRFLFDTANEDRKNPAGTGSAALEAVGVDVRYVNKIMHHKFLIVDGPQESPMQALTATLLSGSGNWSNSAGTRYDENTTRVSGSPELLLRFQAEFNRLWKNSRDFVSAPLVSFETMPIEPTRILDDPKVDAKFTSANFTTYVSSRNGPTFTVEAGRDEIADKLVELIDGAEVSIELASGHLRSRKVSEALLRKRVERKDLPIRIYLDGQEYISEGTQAVQEAELADCLVDAQTEKQNQDCLDKGYLYSFEMQRAGIELRFKHYAYRWHYAYAPQMHDKFLIVDHKVVASGSYNLSDNAEHGTMENSILYDASRFPVLVEGFVENFDSMWELARADETYEKLMAEIETGTGPIPIVYDAMSLTWAQVTALKEALRDHCSDLESDAFRTSPEKHYTCTRVP